MARNSPPMWTHPYRIERELDPARAMFVDSEVAGFNDLDIALLAFRASCLKWPKDRIWLLHGARVIEKQEASL